MTPVTLGHVAMFSLLSIFNYYVMGYREPIEYVISLFFYSLFVALLDDIRRNRP